MSKKNQNTEPYFVNMKLSTEGLASLPPNTTQEGLFLDVCIRAVILYSDSHKGMQMAEHRRLYSLRDTLQNAIKVKDFEKVAIEIDDFRFLMKCWNEQRPEARVNELLMRVEKALFKSQSDHDKEEEIPNK